MALSDAILTRLLSLHPKIIDLSLGRMQVLLEKLGHPEVRFTIEADMDHDTWIRTYMGRDLYDWFLTHSK